MGVGASIFSRRNKCVHAMIFVFFDDAPRWSGVKRIAARAVAHDVHGASSNSKGTVSAAFYIFYYSCTVDGLSQELLPFWDPI